MGEKIKISYNYLQEILRKVTDLKNIGNKKN